MKEKMISQAAADHYKVASLMLSEKPLASKLFMTM